MVTLHCNQRIVRCTFVRLCGSIVRNGRRADWCVGSIVGRRVCLVKRRHLAPIIRTTLRFFSVTSSRRRRPSTRGRRALPASSTRSALSTSRRRRRRRRRPGTSVSRRRRRRRRSATELSSLSSSSSNNIRGGARTWHWWCRDPVTLSTPLKCRRRWAQHASRQTWGNRQLASSCSQTQLFHRPSWKFTWFIWTSSNKIYKVHT